jgi:hypothetical protein
MAQPATASAKPGAEAKVKDAIDHLRSAAQDLHWTVPVDRCIQKLGGKVYRRPKSDIRDDAWYSPAYPYGYYLYPYEYVPPSFPLW